MTRLVNQAKGTVVAERLTVADSVWSRFRGLMGRKELPVGEGLLIRPSTSVHTMFMRFAIDVVFLDRSLRVVKLSLHVKPFRLAAAFRGAHSALELNAGVAAEALLEKGDQLEILEE